MFDGLSWGSQWSLLGVKCKNINPPQTPKLLPVFFDACNAGMDAGLLPNCIVGRYVGFKMAARSVVLRVASLCRRNVALSSSYARKMSIFTRYREPPNGFLFNEKVCHLVVVYFITKSCGSGLMVDTG